MRLCSRPAPPAKVAAPRTPNASHPPSPTLSREEEAFPEASSRSFFRSHPGTKLAARSSGELLFIFFPWSTRSSDPGASSLSSQSSEHGERPEGARYSRKLLLFYSRPRAGEKKRGNDRWCMGISEKDSANQRGDSHRVKGETPGQSANSGAREPERAKTGTLRRVAGGKASGTLGPLGRAKLNQ